MVVMVGKKKHIDKITPAMHDDFVAVETHVHTLKRKRHYEVTITTTKLKSKFEPMQLLTRIIRKQKKRMFNAYTVYGSTSPGIKGSLPMPSGVA